ncbi:MAG: D-alanyl-D-alanine carboxypeptidase [Ruminococcaceae bacterium]|nr:D-alanyl-D-alanine carboxypeptidase [Oscillospiraceae bacterium]
MNFKTETAKKILFVGVVFTTFVLFVIACVYDVTTDNEYLFNEVVDAMGDEEKSVEESSAEEIVSEEPSEEESSEEASEESKSDESFMAGATKGSLEGVYVNSPHCFVYNATDNVILYEKNAYDSCYPASVTKLLTAAVALEYVPIETVFKVGSEINMVGYNSSMAYISEGQSFTLKDLLYALLLPSGNDAAHTIAVGTSRYLYGDGMTNEEAVAKFMELCHEKLAEIGAYNTNFSGPDGYHHDDHYTTAYDMMLISLYATSFEEIVTACGTYKYYCKSVEGDSMGWLNSNPLMKEHGQYYCPLVTGLKTGSTDEAGKCLAITAEKNGKKLYIVILGAPNVDVRNTDMLEIIHSVFGYCPS